MSTWSQYGLRWRIVKRKLDILRWQGHEAPVYWMVEPPLRMRAPIRLYPTFEDARAAFVAAVVAVEGTTG